MEAKEVFSRLKKEAECSICIHTVNKPKSLPCLHSFCLECINSFAATKRKEGNTAFDCPECSATIAIPDGDKFDDFPGLGRIVTSCTDPSSSAAKGKGLREAECGKRAEFTIITKDAEGQMCYSENDEVTVHIQAAAGGDVKAELKNNKDGTLHVTYTPMKHGQHHVMIKINGHVLPACPWNVQVTPHQYQVVSSFDSEFYYIWGVDVSSTGNVGVSDNRGVAVSSTGNVAVIDSGKIKVFSSEGQYLNEFGPEEEAFENLAEPVSVAYINPDHIVAIYYSKALLFKESGEFIKHFSPVHLQSPCGISVTRDGHVLVCEDESKKVIVLSPDGDTLLQSFKAPDCDEAPWYAVHHEDKFFVSYPDCNCIKVFDGAGNHTLDIGQLVFPRGITIDKFNNLVVVDQWNNILQIFTPEGEFVSIIEGTECGQFYAPVHVAVSRDGRLYVTAGISSVHILC